MTGLEKALSDRLSDMCEHDVNKQGSIYVNSNLGGSDDIPDILDMLEDKLDELYDLRAECGVKKYHDPTSRANNHAYEMYETYYSMMKATIARVEKSNACYYAVIFSRHADVWVPNVYKVSLDFYPLYKAELQKDNTVVWTETGEQAAEFTFITDMPIKVHLDNPEILWGQSYSGSEFKYARPNMDADHYFTCKDCGELFCLSTQEVKWFKSNNLCVPKRCDVCRTRRKFGTRNLCTANQAKADSNSEDTNYFSRQI